MAARQPSISSVRPCHACSEFGHLKRTCPRTLRPPVAPQMYPLMQGTNECSKEACERHNGESIGVSAGHACTKKVQNEVISRNLACDQLVTEFTNFRSEQFFAPS